MKNCQNQFHFFPDLEKEEEIGRFFSVTDDDADKLILKDVNTNREKQYDLKTVKAVLLEKRKENRGIEKTYDHFVLGVSYHLILFYL